MQAVLAGQGVALMPTLVVEDELATGRLGQPFSQPYPGQFGYYALSPPPLRHKFLEKVLLKLLRTLLLCCR